MNTPTNDEPSAPDAASSTQDVEGVRLVCLSDVEPEEVSWLWRGRIPLGKLTILDGDPGTAKTTLALDLAARVSRGEPMPDDSETDLVESRGVVLLTAEDGLADTIRPRLDSAGADVERVVALPLVEDPDGTERLPTVRDVDAVRKAIEVADAALVIFDPLAAYLGNGVDSHRDASVRSALGELAQLAENTGVAVLAIRHLNKKSDIAAMYRGMGSIAFTASARSVLLVATDPEDPSEERRVLVSVKCNLAEPPPALMYRPEVVSEGTVRIQWLGSSAYRADELLGIQGGRRPSKREQAERWLQNELSGGPVPTTSLKERAERAGHAWRTVRRAMDEMGVEKQKEGFSEGWSRKLPIQNAERSSGAYPDELATFADQPEQDLQDQATCSNTATSKEPGQLRDEETEPKTAGGVESGQLGESTGRPGTLNGPTDEDGQTSGTHPQEPDVEGTVGSKDVGCVRVPAYLIDGHLGD